ncbi:MAG: DUF3299 domain-containing protein [Candidatus Hydrogenedentes bacterium]|nr:DUF3299 domain-containing protein [Candidatus Hydrogenedentota bacterium]
MRRPKELAGLIVLVAALLGMIMGGGLSDQNAPGEIGRHPQVAEEALFPLADVAYAGTEETPTATPPPPRGAPIDAPAPRAGRRIDTPSVAPGSRNIPQADFEALQESETKLAEKGGSLNFEKTTDGKYFKLTFRGLASFTYKHPDPETLQRAENPSALLGDQIPAPIRALSGQQAVVVGFMVPFELAEDGSITSFAITQNQSFCCYGVSPEINEWVLVEASPALKVAYQPESPVAVFGTLDVGEEIEEGYVLSIYRMKAGDVSDASKLLRKSLLRP